MEESRIYRLLKPLIPKPLRPLALRYQELLCYIVVGCMTTLVNFLIYYPLSRLIHYLAANVIAWICSVTFAFFMNKVFVFQERRWDARSLLVQGLEFAAGRLTSLGMEELILFVFVRQLSLNADVVKVAAQVIVAVMNFLISKFLVFRKQKEEE